MAEIAVSVAVFVAETLITFLNQEGNEGVQVEIEELASWLQSMKAHIRDKEGNENGEVDKDLVVQARKLAYDIEDILDKYKFSVSHEFHRHTVTSWASKMLHFRGDRKARKDLSKSVKKIEGRMIHLRNSLLHSRNAGLVGGSRPLCIPAEHHEIVGYDEKIDLLLDLVKRPDLRHATISVVGSPGTGKSLLVKKIYESKEVEQLFARKAWFQGSCDSRPDDDPMEIIKQLSVTDLGDFENSSYLVVLDDIRRQDDLEMIVNGLPHGVNGSRIIFTTQNSGIISSSSGRSFHSVPLNGLSPMDSWNLFCKKAFDGEKCPPELEELSANIVKRCEGLPFAISALGNLLSRTRTNQNQIEWKKLHDSIFGANSQLSVISRSLMPSFKDLLYTNKICLLYFSIFPEDYSVDRGRLVRLWVAEGFVKEIGSKTAEEVAEDHLNELVQRNLVSVRQREIDGRRVRSCRILNVVHGFIITKAEEYNFVNFVIGEKVRRLSVQDPDTYFADNENWGCVRSSFLFKHKDIIPSKIKLMLSKFKLLRVLDLQDAPLENFPDEIVALKLLIYLSLRQTKIREIPKSIKNLVFLETLDLKQTLVTILPAEIFKLRNLRHLLAYRYDVENYVTFESVKGVELPSGVGELKALLKLTLIKVNRQRGIIKSLGSLIYLRKLGLIGLEKKHGEELCASIQKMKELQTLDLGATTEDEFLDLDYMQKLPSLLQRLHLKGRLEKLPRWISMLDSVAKVSLKWSKLNANGNPLDTLQSLSNLMELELVDTYVGEKLDFKPKMFKKLKVLHIEQFDNLNMIVVGNEAMPMLEILTICKCRNLKMLPLGINNLSVLSQLILRDMPGEFIAMLQKNSDYRCWVNHVKIIHSFTLESSQHWSFQNLS